MPPHIKDPVNLLGCEFPNRVGLSAGLDKNASSVMGFGFGLGFLWTIEVGTVTLYHKMEIQNQECLGLMSMNLL